MQFVAGAFDFLGIKGIKLQRALIAIGLNEINGNNAAASIVDEAFDESGFVHGSMKGARACGLIIAHGGQKSNGLND